MIRSLLLLATLGAIACTPSSKPPGRTPLADAALVEADEFAGTDATTPDATGPASDVVADQGPEAVADAVTMADSAVTPEAASADAEAVAEAAAELDASASPDQPEAPTVPDSTDAPDPGPETVLDGQSDAVVETAPPEIAAPDTAVAAPDAAGPQDAATASVDVAVAVSCATNADCDDKQPCITDSCSGGTCQYLANDDNTVCNDGNPRTPSIYDKCFKGQCGNPYNDCGCQADTDCLVFDDGNLCNGAYLCVQTAIGKQCLAAIAPVVCAQVGCAASVCMPATGTCTTPAVTGPPCDDGKPCTTDSCDSKAGCIHSNVADATPCADGASCTSGQVCGSGMCGGGTSINCDDSDPCTTDSCTGKTCAHTAIAGCAACLQEDFAGGEPSTNWAAWAEYPGYNDWTLGADAAGNNRLFAQWQGPQGDQNGNTQANLVLRRLYLAPSQPAHLDFWYRATVANPACGQDDLRVTVNGKKIWEACATTPAITPLLPGQPPGAGWMHAVVDLAPWLGAPADIEFKALSGTQPPSKQWVEVDQIRVTGACATACVGADFEYHGSAVADPSSVIPQAWEVTATQPGAGWHLTNTDTPSGHTGVAAYTVAFGPTAPPGTVATLRMVEVHPKPTSKLWFAVRAPLLGKGGCAAGQLQVLVGGAPQFQLCQQQAMWSVHSVDLAPWAGQSVAIALVATAAIGNQPAIFQIDDVAVTGACTYACFRETFEDPGEFASWWNLSAQGATEWQLAGTDPGNPSAHAVLALGDTLGPSANATLNPDPLYRWMMPVAGATLGYSAKVETAAKVCPGFLLKALAMYTKSVDVKPTVSNGFAGVAMVDAGVFCAATGGWQAVQTELGTDYGDELRGHKFVPMVAALAPGGVAATLRVDDFWIQCR